VLEQLWLPQRPEENGAFYKGLIQLAGRLFTCKSSGFGRPGRFLNWREQTSCRTPDS